MKKIFTTFFVVVLYAATASAQLLTWSPDFVKDNDNISITLDATKGNLAMLNFANPVYVHTGVITSNSSSSADWRYVKFMWATANTAAQATNLGNNKYRFDITNIRAFYGVPASETIVKISILFRDAAGNVVHRNADGSDMYIPIYGANLATRITLPLIQPTFTPIPEPISKGVGDVLNITGISNNAANLAVTLNGNSVGTANGATTVSANPTLTQSGSNKVIITATQGGSVAKDSFVFFVAPPPNIAALPAGVKEGINYAANNTEVTLVLFAPNKNRVSVIGEFPGSNWQETVNYTMNKTPDGKYWWKTITGLTSGTEYAYQYFVDGTIKIGDPYCQKVLDPWNDPFITAATFPNLKAYPAGQQGIVSVLQTNEPTYTWQIPNFTKPNKRNLVVYELLVRDFVSAHDFKTLKDTLSYFKKLGVNAIEIMPFNEFEGNESWGYNPSFYLAPDKFYGPKNTVKQFIDEAHKEGIAVIMDMTMNHVFGSSPQARLYWDAANNQPAANNPWLNPVATHPFNVGYDFNHQKDETKYLVDRVIEHWLTEYKIDGFRWDLSKGFTQVVSNDVNAWNQYDASRVVTWKRIYDKMQAVAANSYCILEHLGGNDEEKDLANYGMLLWGIENYTFNEMSMGWVTNSNIQGIIHNARNWTVPHLVGYAESHDEERTMYRNVSFGNNSNPNHNVRTLPVGLRRNELIAAHLLMTPGPKMFWQFAELGYDFSINYCPNGTINNACRVDKKPIRWDYYTDPNRKRLYDIYSSLNKLRNLKPNCFANGNTTWGTGGLFKWMVVNEASLKVVVISNMDVNSHTGTVTFPTAGTYYDYLNGGTITATGASQSFTLAPGQYHVFIDQNIDGTVSTPIATVANPLLNMNVLVYPNPIQQDALIEYQLPESGKVAIDIINMNGQTIANVFNGFKATGTHRITLTKTNAKIGNAAGMYFIRFTVNNKQKIEKIIVQ